MAKTDEGKAPHLRCLDAYHDAFVRRMNPPRVVPGLAERYLSTPPRSRERARMRDEEGVVVPRISGGKDATLMKRMVESWGERAVLRVIRLFFTSTDPAVTRGDYSVGWLYMKAQYLLTDGQRQDPKTAANVHAAQRAMGRE